MEIAEEKKLDNPVWFALHETHAPYAIHYEGGLSCYDPDYCAFGAIYNPSDISGGLLDYSSRSRNFFIVGEKPESISGLVLFKNLVCLQMILERPVSTIPTEEVIKLNTDHEEAITDLVSRVQPGYFRNKTSRLGDYAGIFRGDNLVAISGECKVMQQFTEVSAVVTHPDWLGRGFASQLIAFISNKIFEEGKIPFLHVAETNIPAIRLYEKLGFIVRRMISFWNMVSAE